MKLSYIPQEAVLVAGGCGWDSCVCFRLKIVKMSKISRLWIFYKLEVENYCSWCLQPKKSYCGCRALPFSSSIFVLGQVFIYYTGKIKYTNWVPIFRTHTYRNTHTHRNTHSHTYTITHKQTNSVAFLEAKIFCN